MPSSLETVLNYHERSKHHFSRYARSLGYLDWSTQPDPFRRYSGAELFSLPLPPQGRPLPYSRIYQPASIIPEPLSLQSISLFFRYALSITAWKRLGQSSWSLRANPSSGNLHPTEGYALLPATEGLSDAPSVYHYAPREHGLEQRAPIEPRRWDDIAKRLPQGSFLAGLSSIHWREAWKYGERAFRYCQQDIGHAVAAMRIAAATLGWTWRILDGLPDADMARLMGLDREGDFGDAERETADLLALVTPGPAVGPNISTDDLVSLVEGARWQGRANRLGDAHAVDWPVIDEVDLATRSERRPAIHEEDSGLPTLEELFVDSGDPTHPTAETVILGRRSAIAMDGETRLDRKTFFYMLSRVMPTKGPTRGIPWDAIPWRPRLHLALFVHRVDGIAPGLYLLARDPRRRDSLQSAMKKDFFWRKPEGCPSGLPLFLLEEGDCRALAARVSCGQAIASDGAFSLGMIADFENSLKTFGPAFYKNSFWEAGMIGQVLYLEAENAGIRATGIGCYFDDPVHDVLGITSRDWQSLYHFTVGGALEDSRLTSLPAY